jgi:hypothetical protein
VVDDDPEFRHLPAGVLTGFRKLDVEVEDCEHRRVRAVPVIVRQRDDRDDEPAV